MKTIPIDDIEVGTNKCSDDNRDNNSLLSLIKELQ